MDAIAMKATLNLSKFWRDEWTNDILAKELDVHPNTISNLRRGVDKVSLVVLVKVARLVGKSIDEVIEVSEDD